MDTTIKTNGWRRDGNYCEYAGYKVHLLGKVGLYYVAIVTDSAGEHLQYFTSPKSSKVQKEAGDFVVALARKSTS